MDERSRRPLGLDVDARYLLRDRELPAGTHYKGGEEDATFSLVSGNIRAGRTLEVRQRILREISDSWSRLTGQPATQLMIALAQTDASDVMEAGLILPEPGQETAWFDQHRDQLSELAPDGLHGL